MIGIDNYENLKVWQAAHTLALETYKITKTFPEEEKYGLVSQLRRSAASIPQNIAEGQARYHNKEFIRFLYVARGSLAEILYHLRLSKDLEYLDDETYQTLKSSYKETERMLNGLINSLKDN